MALPILTFHALDEKPSPISFSPRVFRQGIASLQASGYKTLTLLDAIGYLQAGLQIPPRAFVLTFDDGYASVYDVAFPILQRFGMSATVFLTVGQQQATGRSSSLLSLNGRSMLTWEQIREMQQAGLDFGAHTLTHPDLTELADQQLASEILDSKAIIEDKLGFPVETFAYPFGRYDERAHAIASQNFRCACTDRLGLAGRQSDLHALERVEMYYFRSRRAFSLILSPLFRPYLTGHAVARHLRRRILWDRFRRTNSRDSHDQPNE